MYLGTRIHDGNLSGGRCTHLAVLRSHCFTAGDFLVHQILSVVVALLLLVAGWFHYHVLAPSLEWFASIDSALNHHLAGLFGLRR